MILSRDGHPLVCLMTAGIDQLGGLLEQVIYFHILRLARVFQVKEWPGFAYRWRADSVVTNILSSCSCYQGKYEPVKKSTY